MRHRHIRAENDEWVHVHRPKPPVSSPSNDDGVWIVIVFIGVIVVGLVYRVIQLLLAIWPWLLGALILYVAFKLFGKRLAQSWLEKK
jgi:hypothetical protein